MVGLCGNDQSKNFTARKALRHDTRPQAARRSKLLRTLCSTIAHAPRENRYDRYGVLASNPRRRLCSWAANLFRLGNRAHNSVARRVSNIDAATKAEVSTITAAGKIIAQIVQCIDCTKSRIELRCRLVASKISRTFRNSPRLSRSMPHIGQVVRGFFCNAWITGQDRSSRSCIVGSRAEGAGGKTMSKPKDVDRAPVHAVGPDVRVTIDEAVCAAFFRLTKIVRFRNAFTAGHRAWRLQWPLFNPYRGRQAKAWIAGRFIEHK